MTFVPSDDMQEALAQQARSCAKCRGTDSLAIARFEGRMKVYWYIVMCDKCGGWRRSSSPLLHIAIKKWNDENDREEGAE